MIIPMEKTFRDRLHLGFGASQHNGDFGEIDSPPDYNEIEGLSPIPAPSATTSSSPASLANSNIPPANNTPKDIVSAQPVNNVSISHPFGSIDCAYTIDPTLILFPSSSRGTRIRSNVKLRTNVGTIKADLTLVCGVEDNIQSPSTSPRATIDISSKMGTVDVTLRRPSTTALPNIRLFISSHTGSLSVHIPTNYHGFIVAYTKVGRLTMDYSLKSSAVVLREDLKVKRVFIGDPAVLKSSDHPAETEGDMNRSEYVHGKSEIESDSESEEIRGNNRRWRGDEIVLRTPVGNIDVGYIEGVFDLQNSFTEERLEFNDGQGRGYAGHRGRGGRGSMGSKGRRGGGRLGGIRGGRGGKGYGGRPTSPPGPHSPSAGRISA